MKKEMMCFTSRREAQDYVRRAYHAVNLEEAGLTVEGLYAAIDYLDRLKKGGSCNGS